MLFGFCISDCAGTGSNVNGNQAAQIVRTISAAFPDFGGVYIWAVSDDISWSEKVLPALGVDSSGNGATPTPTSSSGQDVCVPVANAHQAVTVAQCNECGGPNPITWWPCDVQPAICQCH